MSIGTIEIVPIPGIDGVCFGGDGDKSIGIEFRGFIQKLIWPNLKMEHAGTTERNRNEQGIE